MENSYEKINNQEKSENISKKVDKILEKLFNESFDESLNLRFEKIPLLSAVLATIPLNENDDIKVKELEKSKPLKDLRMLEVGFGSPQDAHLFLLSRFGAEMYGIEKNEENVERTRRWINPEDYKDGEKLLLQKENIKEGNATKISEFFQNVDFDYIVSSRVFEEYPMCGADDGNIGIKKTIDILKETNKKLKNGGFSVHTTTEQFLLQDKKELEKIGFEILALNKKFNEECPADVYYYTILQKN